MGQEEGRHHDFKETYRILRAEMDEICGTVYQQPAENLCLIPDPAALSSSKRRILVRSVFAALDAFAYKLKHSAVTSGEAAILSEAEKALCREQAFELSDAGAPTTRRAKLRFLPNLRFAFAIYAKSCGLTFQLDAGSSDWRRLVLSAKVRDRLMHPKHSNDLEVSDAEARAALAGYLWVEWSLVALLELSLKKANERIAATEKKITEMVKSLKERTTGSDWMI